MRGGSACFAGVTGVFSPGKTDVLARCVGRYVQHRHAGV